MWTPTILAATFIIAGTALAHADNAKPFPRKIWPSSELAARQPTQIHIQQLSSGIYGAATSRLVDPVEWQHRRAVNFNEITPKTQGGGEAPFHKSEDR
jgi:hypothetical protein